MTTSLDSSLTFSLDFEDTLCVFFSSDLLTLRDLGPGALAKASSALKISVGENSMVAVVLLMPKCIISGNQSLGDFRSDPVLDAQRISVMADVNWLGMA